MDHRTPGSVRQNVLPVLTRSFTSSNQTITFSGGLTIAHGLGTMPVLVQARIKCLVGDAGYSIGDEVLFPAGAQFGSSNAGLMVFPDATNLGVRFGPAMGVLGKSTGTNVSITAASWALILRAYV